MLHPTNIPPLWGSAPHRTKLWALLLLLCVATTAVSCHTEPPHEPSLRSIASLRALYRGYPRLVTEECFIEGCVVSDDRYGQFSRRLALQDDTGGIFISIDHPQLYTLHSPGDTLRVNCLGLTIGGYGGSAMLGAEGSGQSEVTPLDMPQWMLHHTALGQGPLPAATHRTIATLGPTDMATRVRICNVEIVEAGERWEDVALLRSFGLIDPTNEGDTLRVWLGKGGDYHNATLPYGVVDVVGVLDYFANDYQLIVASPSAVLEREEK